MIERKFIAFNRRALTGPFDLWKEYLNWFWKAKTIYDIHSPLAFSLARLFLQLKKGANKKNHLLLCNFIKQNAELHYFTEKQLVGIDHQLLIQLSKNSDVIIYVEKFRQLINPNPILTAFPSQKSILLEGADQLLFWIKTEDGEMLHFPIVGYKFKFWRAGFW